MIIRLRTAYKRDLGEILAINDSVQGNPWSQKSLEEELERPSSFQQVALDPVDRVVGYLLARESGETTEILMIGVAADAKRQGIGRRLIQALVRHSGKAQDLFLEVSDKNQEAAKFYLALGFKTYLVRRSYYRDGSDALCMKLNLANP